MQSMRRSMDWTLEENMVDAFFLCHTHKPQRWPYPFVAYKQE